MTRTRRLSQTGAFGRGGAVVDAGAGERRDAGRRMLAILHAGGGQQRARDDLAAVAQRQALVSAVDRDAGHFERHEHLGAEPLCLRDRAPGQLAAADAGREAEIVLDLRAGARLPARRMPIEQQRPQSLGGAVHRGGEPGRSGAHDHEVVEIARRGQRSAEALGHLARLRVAQRGAVLEEQRRQLAGVDAGGVEQAARVRIALDVEPAIGNEIAGEEVLDGVRARRPLVADQPQSLRLGEVLGLPPVEQIVDHREEAFLGRIPGLREVVIEVGDVDRLDRRVDVRVGGEEHAPRQRVDVARLREHVGALHARHALIADHHRQRIAARLELADGGQRLFPRRRADDGVVLAIAAAQVAAHRRQHLRVVVHHEKSGLVHECPVPAAAPAVGRNTRNSVRPGLDSTSISASLCVTRRRTMSRPRPVPLPTGLVVKNGSKIRSRCSGGMPGPLSTIRTIDVLAVAGGGHVDAAALGHRVQCVVDQVRPDLVQLADEAAHARQRGVEIDRDGDRLRRGPSTSAPRPCWRGWWPDPPARPPWPDPCG